MNEPKKTAPPADLPEAKIRRARPAWLLWLIPLGAAALCIWFLYRDFIATGPKITIYFQNAEGLDPGNTAVKYRGAEVGIIKSLALTPDHQRVKVTARLISSAKDLAKAGTLYWIVRPEVKVGAISGLRTIISGEYVAVQPGNGPATNTFAGVEKEPTQEEPKSLTITLLSPNLGSIQGQSPVFYRGIQVGEVLQYQLGSDAQEVVIQARIHADYAPLIRMNTKFWNAGGINVRLSLFHGAEFAAESPQTLLTGGIEFSTPPNLEAPATNGIAFRLYEKPDETWKTWTPAIKLHLPQQSAQTPALPNLPLK
jgi:paraquat-inducible protein B